MNEVKKSGI